MSIAANVTVFECDGCHAMTSVKSDAEFEVFETSWHTGLLCDFCPQCRNTPTALTRIAAEKQSIARLIVEHKDEVLNAEFIN